MRLLTVFFTMIFMPVLASAQTVKSSDDYEIVFDVVADNLDYPWAVAAIPDGRFLVTEKPGRLMLVNEDGEKTEVRGLPPNLISRRQGGLLDIILAPDFARSRMVYFSYVGRGYGGTGTEVARAVLKRDRLENLEVIFKAQPKMRSDVHFGSRLLFAPDGTLFITLGERYRMDEAQNPGNHLGAVVRINPDGSVPNDNPFAGREGYRPEIYSYGHRNVQGIALQPGTERIWIHEHGPQGGDEVNILKPGANYGWPEITYGIDYDDTIISEKTHKEGMEQPVIHWTPSIAPSGMAFYEGDRFPAWHGDIFAGALVGTHVRRLEVQGADITGQEILLGDLGMRFRDVTVGPDGYIYLLTDAHDGLLVRLKPSE